MIDPELTARLAVYLAQPEASLHARHGAHMLAYVERLDRNIARGLETLEAERQLVGLPDVVSHPLYASLVGLEQRAQRLVASLSPEQQAEYRSSFDQRWSRAVNEWRTEHGYLTEPEMAAHLAAHPEQCQVDGQWVVLTRAEGERLPAVSVVCHLCGRTPATHGPRDPIACHGLTPATAGMPQEGHQRPDSHAQSTPTVSQTGGSSQTGQTGNETFF